MHRLFKGAQDRRSIRVFTPEPVTPSQVASILEAARRAPSAINLQPTRVLVVSGARDLAVIRSAAYGTGASVSAPCIFVCMVDSSGDDLVGERATELVECGALEPVVMNEMRSGAGRPFELKVGRDVALMNCAIAVAHMEMQAVELGLGTCWFHHADFQMIRDHFGIPEHLEIVTLLAVGHSDEEPAYRPRLADIEWKPGQ